MTDQTHLLDTAGSSLFLLSLTGILGCLIGFLSTTVMLLINGGGGIGMLGVGIGAVGLGLPLVWGEPPALPDRSEDVPQARV